MRKKTNTLAKRSSALLGLETSQPEVVPANKNANHAVVEQACYYLLTAGCAAGATWFISKWLHERRMPEAIKGDKKAEEGFSGWVKENHPEYSSKLGKAWDEFALGWICALLPEKEKPNLSTENDECN